MAVSESGSQIWNANDLMTSEKAIFKEVRFIKASKVDPKSDDWLYVQEESPVKLSEISKLIVEKLRPAITEQVTKSNTFYNIMKEGQAAKPKEYQMDEKEAAELVATHKLTFGYGPEMEAMMVAIGKIHKAVPGEAAYDYLTRLHKLASSKQSIEEANLTEQYQQVYEKFKKQQQQLEALKQYEAAQKQYAGMQNQYGQYQQYQYYASSTAAPPLSPFIPAAPVQQPVLLPYVDTATEPQAVPEPEKPKVAVPDPVEPKKRLMKRSDD
jgi:hypothetical protein